MKILKSLNINGTRIEISKMMGQFFFDEITFFNSGKIKEIKSSQGFSSIKELFIAIRNK